MSSHPPEASTQPGRAKTKSTQVNIRVTPGQLVAIDAASEALGRNRMAFMLETAVQAAKTVLLDKRLFTVDDATYQQFISRLDAQPADNPRLHALLQSKATWER